MPDLSYSQLSAMLLSLGFERRVIRGSHVLFTHEKTETIVALPIARGRQKVRMANIVATRFLLDAKGIIPSQKWESLAEDQRKHS